MDGLVALAKSYNLPLVAYEGGNGGSPSPQNWPLYSKVVETDPRMYGVYQNLVSLWQTHVGTLNNFYALNDTYWGLLQSMNDPGSPKFDAVVSGLVPAGDANLDGKVDATDLAIVEKDMGKQGMWWRQGDFNHDGVVDSKDLGIVEAAMPPASDKVTFVATDTKTQGTWKGTYGSAGYNVIANQAALPPGVALNAWYQSNWTWASSTTDPRTPEGCHRVDRQDRGHLVRPAVHGGSRLHRRPDPPALHLRRLGHQQPLRAGGRGECEHRRGARQPHDLVVHNGTYLTWNISGHVDSSSPAWPAPMPCSAASSSTAGRQATWRPTPRRWGTGSPSTGPWATT